MADEIVIEPKQPTNPAVKPGVGGLAAIPGVIGAIVGADDFCSVWNFPLSAVCIADPNDPERHAIPAWCPYMPTGVLCPGVETPKNEDTGVNFDAEHCFDADWNSIPCKTVNKCSIPQFILYQPWVDGTSVTKSKVKETLIDCNTNLICYDKKGVVANCDLAPFLNFIFKMDDSSKCYSGSSWNSGTRTVTPCIGYLNYEIPATGSSSRMFDKYMRLTDYNSGIPISNSEYEGGYPMNAVYPPPPPEPEPEKEPVKPPFDAGPNPFNPDLPVIPDGEDCAGIICECIALVVNALGAVNNTLLVIDDSVLSIVSAIQDKVLSIPEGAEVLPFDDEPILDKLSLILKSIDDISFEVTKEAGTNMWDFLGSAFGDIFDLIEFLIEKVIYLVVPEDTTNIVAAFDNLNGLIGAKMKPVDQVKTAIDSSMNVEKKNFEDIYIELPAYGRVKFFETEYIEIALPYVKRIMSAIMILMTAFYAYRKVSSEMIR